MPCIILKKVQFKKRRHSGSQKSLNPYKFLRFINLKIYYDKGVLYCCNFMEQINQWFVGPFRFSYKTVVKDDCLEGTRARSRIIC